MSRKLLLSILLALLIGTLNLASRVEKVEAIGTIYIRADGSIDPVDAPISTLDNITYTLTGNIISDAHGIFLMRSNMTLDGAGFTLLGTRNGTGIYMHGTSNVTVIDTTVNNFTFGFSLGDSFYNNIVANNITNNEYAIFDYGSWFYPSNNNITANNITANNEGIDLSQSSNNTITGNNITAGFDVAILLTSSSNYNSISQNNIANNGKGIWLHESSNNSIVNNNFVNNTQQVYVEKSGYTNFWDSGHPSGGNYWSNYTGTDANHDGIGDTPYIIDANNTDNDPLMGMFSEFNVSLPYGKTGNVTIISNSTVSNLSLLIWLSSPYEGLQPGQPFIQFSAKGENGRIGFCRLLIPRTVLNSSSYIVLVDSNPVNAAELPVSNSTHVYLYFTYAHSTHEVIVTIPEFASCLVLSLFMITTLLATILRKKKS